MVQRATSWPCDRRKIHILRAPERVRNRFDSRGECESALVGLVSAPDSGANDGGRSTLRLGSCRSRPRRCPEAPPVCRRTHVRRGPCGRSGRRWRSGLVHVGDGWAASNPDPKVSQPSMTECVVRGRPTSSSALRWLCKPLGPGQPVWGRECARAIGHSPMHVRTMGQRQAEPSGTLTQSSPQVKVCV